MRVPSFILRWALKSSSTITTSMELEAALRSLGLTNPTRSGQSITRQRAMEQSTVLSCVRVLADGVAQVPLKLMRQTGESHEVARDHSLHRIVSLVVNPYTTSFSWRETMMLHLGLAEHYAAFINRIGPDVKELWPIEPHRVKVKERRDTSRYYEVTLKDGSLQEVEPEDMLYVTGPSWGPTEALDIIKLAREAIGLSLATEASAANLYGKGIRPSGIYSVDGTLGKAQYAGLRKHLQDTYGAGSESEGGPIVLDRSAKWTPTAMTSVDAQHYEMRRLQIEEICRFYRVMPIMVGHADKVATYASAEQMFLAHVVHTLSPWYTRLEQAFSMQLLTEREREQGLYFKFFPIGLMRGASLDRGKFYSMALGAGGSQPWMTVDQVRGLEEMNPMGGAAAELPERTQTAPPTNNPTDNSPGNQE